MTKILLIAISLLVAWRPVVALINVSYSEIIQKRLEKIGSKNSRLVVMKGRGHAQSKYIASSSLMDEFVTFLDTHMR